MKERKIPIDVVDEYNINNPHYQRIPECIRNILNVIIHTFILDLVQIR